MPKLELNKLTNIKIIGLGNTGCNSLNRLEHLKKKGVERIAVGLMGKSIDNAKVEKKIILNPKERFKSEEHYDKDGALELVDKNKDKIRMAIEGADIVFLIGNLSRHLTGVLLARIGQAARKQGIISFAVVNKPFSFEGKNKKDLSDQYIKSLPEAIDSMLIISSDSLLQSDLPVTKALTMSDTTVARTVDTLLEIIFGIGQINVDFNDFRATIKDLGYAYIGTGSGKRASLKSVVERASDNKYFESKFRNVDKLLYVITTDSKFTLNELALIGSFMEKRCSPEAQIIFGMVVDEKLEGDVKITILAGRSQGVNERQAERSAEQVEKPVQASSVQRNVFRPAEKPVQKNDDQDIFRKYDRPAFERRGKKFHDLESEEKLGNEETVKKKENNEPPAFIRKKLQDLTERSDK